MNTAEHSASATAATTPRSSDVVPIDPEREVRFAVVMYGGVSLAIYINGVAQELLNLVRATALKPGSNDPLLNDDELTGAGKVYRKLGQYTGSQAPRVPRSHTSNSEFDGGR